MPGEGDCHPISPNTPAPHYNIRLLEAKEKKKIKGYIIYKDFKVWISYIIYSLYFAHVVERFVIVLYKQLTCFLYYLNFFVK